MPKKPPEQKPPPFPHDGLVNINQALAFLDIGRTHFYSLIKKGSLPPPTKLGSACRWPAKRIREVAGVQ